MKIINFESSCKDSKAADNKLSHILEVNHFCTSCTCGTFQSSSAGRMAKNGRGNRGRGVGRRGESEQTLEERLQKLISSRLQTVMSSVREVSRRSSI